MFLPGERVLVHGLAAEGYMARRTEDYVVSGMAAAHLRGARRQAARAIMLTPYWTSHNGETALTLYQGDVREVLRQMPAESVHCVVTSPPYWGLRDYGVLGQIGQIGQSGKM